MNLKTGQSRSSTGLTGDSLFEQIRLWLAEINEAKESVHQIDKVGLRLLLLAGLLLVGMVSIATGLGMAKHPYDPIWIYATFGLSVFASVAIFLKPDYSGLISHVLVASFIFINVSAIRVNGILPVALIPGMSALVHILFRPNTALVYNVLGLSAATVMLMTGEKAYDPQILSRLLSSSIVTLVFWQIAARFWRKLMNRVSAVTMDMSDVLQRLDAERLEAHRAAQEALRIEPASGLLNRDGFLAKLADIFQAGLHSSEKPGGLVVAIRFPGWMDATTYLDPAVQENLLRTLIARMRHVLGPDAVFARTGNEDYLAWVPGSEHTPTASLLENLRADARQLDLAITSGTFSVPTQPRIGICRAPEDGWAADILLADAELALMAAVRRSHSMPVLFTPKLLVDAEERHLLLHDLEKAVAGEQLVLHYQPVLSVSGQGLCKAEALIRWKHPHRGLLYPDAFIGLAEQSDLIIDITDWVLRGVASQIQTWRKTLHPQMQVSINMPPAYLLLCARDPMAMLDKLKALAIPQGALVLEITEGVMLDVTPELVNAIDMLRSLGFLVAVDDFGVGYSNFSQLCKLKIDYLKLDKSFIRDLDQLPRQQAVCRAIVQMAHELGYQVVAEGIETVDERDLLKQMNADYLQGYLFCRPMPVPEFDAWCARTPNHSPFLTMS